jgi:hypothetical protein
MVFIDHELEQLCTIAVLEWCGASKWVAPTFITPEKDGRVWWMGLQFLCFEQTWMT